MTEDEYILAQDLAHLIDARRVLSEIVPEMNPILMKKNNMLLTMKRTLHKLIEEHSEKLWITEGEE